MTLALFGIGVSELFVLAILLAGLAFPIWMIVDCVRNERDHDNRLMWIVIIFLTGIFGALVYLFARKLHHGRASAPPPIPRV
jgi:hypothetical protein